MISSVKAVRLHSLSTGKTKTQTVEIEVVTKPHIAIHATRSALCLHFPPCFFVNLMYKLDKVLVQN